MLSRHVLPFLHPYRLSEIDYARLATYIEQKLKRNAEIARAAEVGVTLRDAAGRPRRPLSPRTINPRRSAPALPPLRSRPTASIPRRSRPSPTDLVTETSQNAICDQLAGHRHGLASQRNTASPGLSESGRPDLNRGPPAPKAATRPLVNLGICRTFGLLQCRVADLPFPGFCGPFSDVSAGDRDPGPLPVSQLRPRGSKVQFFNCGR